MSEQSTLEQEVASSEREQSPEGAAFLEHIQSTLHDLEVSATEMKQEKDTGIHRPEVELSKKKKNLLHTMVGLRALMRVLLFAGVVTSSSGERGRPISDLSPNEEARQELLVDGITHIQRRAYKPAVSEAFQQAIDPATSYEIAAQVDHIVQSLTGDRTKENLGRFVDVSGAEDAWRMYLGLPQEHNTFGISDHRPSQSTEYTYYYKINDFFKNYHERWVEGHWQEALSSESDAHMIKFLIEKIDAGQGTFQDFQGAGDPMGKFSWSRGQDEHGSYLAYYDRWDLNVPVERNQGFIGHPYEIYDRIYFDEQTFKPEMDVSAINKQ